jgi:hypothetical protein
MQSSWIVPSGKCDVEGTEVEVFRGAQRVLTDKRPIIVCEVHSEENRLALIESFSQFAYQCMDWDDRHVLALPL